MSVPSVFEPLKMFDALVASERLAGVQVMFGAHDLNVASPPPRVVMVLDGGDFGGNPESHDNLDDLPVAVECHCWAVDYESLWSLICNVTRAVQDFRLSSDIDARRGGVQWGKITDTTRNGRYAVATFIVRSVVADTPLTAAAGSAVVVSESFTST